VAPFGAKIYEDFVNISCFNPSFVWEVLDINVGT